MAGNEDWHFVKKIKPFPVGHPDSIVMTLPIEAREALGKISEFYEVYVRADGCILYKPTMPLKERLKEWKK